MALKRHNTMIVAGIGPLIYIDLGKGEPGIKLQRRERVAYLGRLHYIGGGPRRVHNNGRC